MPWFGLRERKPEIVHDVEEGIAPWNPVALEHALKHQPQLVIANARIHLADFLYGVNDTRQASNILRIILLLLVVRLF